MVCPLDVSTRLQASVFDGQAIQLEHNLDGSLDHTVEYQENGDDCFGKERDFGHFLCFVVVPNLQKKICTINPAIN